jgi:C-terminal processing protease CtpA/Prc
MTRRFLNLFVLSMAFLLAAQNLSRADTTDALAKSSVLENDALYLRVGHVGKNLAEEIQSAQSALAATNKIAGTILDLRFADGDDLDSEKAAANLFASEKSPLAILVNGKTRGAAEKLAVELRDAHDGLIFGSSTEVKPDIAVPVKIEDEKKFLENPYGTLAQDETNSAVSTNDFASFVDHTTEADLVREKIKDGDQDEDSVPTPAAEPQKPFIRDPVLARAVDLIKGLAVVRQSHL